MMTRERKLASRRFNGGFSLVELMISMVLGLLLMGGLLTVFNANLQSSELSRSLSYMQSNARFVLDRLQEELRMAGYQGCSDPAATQLNILASAAPTDNYRATRIFVAEVGDTSWTPAMPYGYSAPTGAGAPVVGTHSLLLQYASSEQGELAADMTSNASDIVMSSNPLLDFQSGDLAVIGNCSSAALFSIASLSNATDTTTITPTETLPMAYAMHTAAEVETTTTSGTGTASAVVTSIHRFNSQLYYVGDTGRTNKDGDAIHALYLQSWPYTDTNPPIELVEGVDQFLIGLSMADGDQSEYLAPGDTGFDTRKAQSVYFGILMSSIERVGSAGTNRNYRLAGRQVSPAASGVTGPTYPADRRVRRPFATVVKIRNTLNDS